VKLTHVHNKDDSVTAFVKVTTQQVQIIIHTAFVIKIVFVYSNIKWLFITIRRSVKN